jgi:hypothetical protein
MNRRSGAVGVVVAVLAVSAGNSGATRAKLSLAAPPNRHVFTGVALSAATVHFAWTGCSALGFVVLETPQHYLVAKVAGHGSAAIHFPPGAAYPHARDKPNHYIWNVHCGAEAPSATWTFSFLATRGKT